MSTPIGENSKKELANLVAENHTYDKWYAKFHAKADLATTAKFQDEMAELDKLAIEKKAEKAKHEDKYKTIVHRQAAERRVMDKKHSDETDVIGSAHKRAEKVIGIKEDKIESKLREAGFESNYTYGKNDEREYRWKISPSRLTNEYTNWLRSIRIKVLTSLTVEEARTHTEEFLLN